MQDAFFARQRGSNEIGTGEDDCENVVEVVRNSSGQLSDRFHFLGLPELHLERVLFGMGASLEKRRFGAQATRNALYVQIHDTYAFDTVAQMSAEE